MSTIAEKLTTIAENQTKVYEAGRQAEYDEFWDTFQENGNRTQYTMGSFSGPSWYDARFKPKYDVVISGNCNYAFSNTEIRDFKGCVEAAGISFTFENITNAPYLFYFARVTNLPSIDFSKASSESSLSLVFYYCIYLKSIDKIIISENTKFSTNSFGRCKELETVLFEGILAKNGLVLNDCTKLSKASWQSIINSLSSTTSGLSISGSLASVNTAFETSEGANDGSTSAEWEALLATKTNWTINLV